MAQRHIDLPVEAGATPNTDDNCYTASVLCDNCGFEGDTQIRKGTRVEKQAACPTCGCATLALQEKPQSGRPSPVDLARREISDYERSEEIRRQVRRETERLRREEEHMRRLEEESLRRHSRPYTTRDRWINYHNLTPQPLPEESAADVAPIGVPVPRSGVISTDTMQGFRPADPGVISLPETMGQREARGSISAMQSTGAQSPQMWEDVQRAQAAFAAAGYTSNHQMSSPLLFPDAS